MGYLGVLCLSPTTDFGLYFRAFGKELIISYTSWIDLVGKFML